MGIRVECERCGFKYHLKDSLAGKKAKCKICQAVFVVPAAPPPVSAPLSPGGSQLLAHAPRTSEFQPAIGDSETSSESPTISSSIGARSQPSCTR